MPFTNGTWRGRKYALFSREFKLTYGRIKTRKKSRKVCGRSGEMNATEGVPDYAGWG